MQNTTRHEYTHASLFTHFHAQSSLTTRHIEPTIPLPATLTPVPHMEIIDVHKFITTALTRLESESPLIRGIAERMLRAFINHTTHEQANNLPGAPDAPQNPGNP